MESVVYILGAGFSAPLGLPLMSNFNEKARSLARNNPNQFGYFNELLNNMRQTGHSRDYFEFMPDNIEEALSILEMSEYLGRDTKKNLYAQLIKDVIRNYTPDIPHIDTSKLGQSWKEHIFSEDRDNKWHYYGHFVASLLNLSVTQIDDYNLKLLRSIRLQTTQANYSVVTLNYDLVLENITEFINLHLPIRDNKVGFLAPENYHEQNHDMPFLAKLHGGVREGDIIIPPTFNKGLYQPDLPKSWQLAYNLLMKANHVRIIGYSLPQTDSYIKYILKAAVIHFMDLERIDIICLDETGDVYKRYKEFIPFKKRRFVSDDVVGYLGYIHQLRTIQDDDRRLKFDKLERAHEEYVSRHETRNIQHRIR